MPVYFQSLDNALKRSKEFLDVQKYQPALDVLHDVIKSKKHRAWQKTHEPIMAKYLELCVILQKSHVAKEGLYQYKNICQNVNVKSLEDVIRKYLSMASEKTEEARNKSHQVVINVDDLDVIQSPEDLLMCAVSNEDNQDRNDRAILTPWVKFLWESYRQCLDLLRNNSTVERLYQDIAQNAFKFCLQYQRKTEFRKLCDSLRMHLGHIHKYQHQQRAINLNNPESQAMHLETRLVQLDSAIKLELWQEAFKAVEDIHGLIALSKKQPKPSLMANYYQKLALVFLKSGNQLFHACAWHRLLCLSKEQKKNLSESELSKLSSRVLCATLAIPLTPGKNEIFSQDDSYNDKRRRLATLLGLPSVPTRSTLIKDLAKYNIVPHVYPELRPLFKSLEVDFQPLKMSAAILPCLEFIENNEMLAIYLPQIQDVAITKILQQVSQVYQSIEYTHFCSLMPFADRFRIETIIVKAVKTLGVQVRLCHRTQCLSFGTDLSAETMDTDCASSQQNMPGEFLRSQLTNMSLALEKAITVLQPNQRQKDELRAHIVQSYRQTAEQNHVRILERWKIIEEHKEELENQNLAKEQKERAELEEQQMKQIQAEQERLGREAEERSKERIKREQDEIARKSAQERLEQLKSTALGAKVFAEMSEAELAKLDADEIMARQVQQLEKEKREMAEKLGIQEKQIDYLERAKRLKEIPLLENAASELAEKNAAKWQEYEQQRVEDLKAERENALKQRDRLKRMRDEKEKFFANLNEARMSVYKEKLAEFEKKFAEERKKRLEDRKEKRINDRRAKYYREKEEAEQKRKDEEAKRIREAEEERVKAEREKEQAEYKAYLEKQNAIAEKMKQKEKEIEERQRREKEDSHKATQERPSWRSSRDAPADRDEKLSSRPDSAWKPSGGGSKPSEEGGWRAREKAREESWKPSRSDDRDEDRKPASRLGMPRDIRLDDPAEDRFKDKREESGGGSWRRGGDGGGGGGSWRDRERAKEGGDDRREDRGGYGNRRDDDRGYGSRRDDDRGYGSRRDDDRGYGSRRDDDRGYGSRRDDDRGYGSRRDDDRGYGSRRDDDRGGYGRRDEDRGGYSSRRDDDRGGYGRRDGGGRRDDDRGGSSWRRDEPQSGDSWRRDGGGARDRPRDDGGKWGKDRGGDRGGDRGSDRAPPKDTPSRSEGGDGWTTVKH